MSDEGINFHKIIEGVNTTFTLMFSAPDDPIFAWLRHDMTKNAAKFQRFYAGDLNWVFPKVGNLKWNHIVSPVGLLAPRTYLEWDIAITIEDHKEIAPVQSRQALLMWGPEFFPPKMGRSSDGLDLVYVSLEFTKQHPLFDEAAGGKKVRWVPDPALSCVWQGTDENGERMLCGTVVPSKAAQQYLYGNTENLVETYRQDGARAGYIYTKFLDALKCSNVVLCDNAAPAKLNKKRTARGNIPLFSYKTLHIKSDRMVGAERGGTHSSPRLHFRRGHVRRLSLERSVWVRDCMVGNSERGVVEKDYVVS